MSKSSLKLDIPSDWSVLPLPEIVYFQEGPGLMSDKFRESGTPFLNIRCFENGYINRLTCQCVSPTLAFGAYKHFLLDEGDLVFSSSGTIGKIATIRKEDLPLMLNTSTIRFRTRDESVIARDYIRVFLGSDNFKVQHDHQSQGSAQVNVGPTHLAKMFVPLPPIGQQRKIAQILTTLDNLIEKTEALIAKYQAIKQGMMHDLFTRGVDEHGHLRPPYEQAPQLYKQSELGWIPKEWEVGGFGEEIGPIVSGWSPICDSIPAALNEWAILKTTAVVWDGYDENENKRLPAGFTPIASIEVRPDDILITRKGPVERVGVVVHVPETRSRLMVPDTVFRVRLLDNSTLLPSFVPLSLGCDAVQRDWFGRKVGLADAQVNVNHGILRQTRFPKPTKDEQHRIVELVAKARARIQHERRSASKLHEMKTGLMQDLLTGKVRVKVDEAEEDEA